MFVLLLVATAAVAQKKKVESGDYKNLAGVTEFNVEFDYSNIKVAKFDNEEDFLADKMKKREEKGKDEDFRKNWFADREARYEPKFLESFNKRFDNGAVKADKGLTSAKYTMKVKTEWIQPGYNVGISRQNAEVTATITFYETANPSNVVLKLRMERSPGVAGMGMDFNSGDRIAESYAKMAKELANDIRKKAK